MLVTVSECCANVTWSLTLCVPEDRLTNWYFLSDTALLAGVHRAHGPDSISMSRAWPESFSFNSTATTRRSSVAADVPEVVTSGEQASACWARQIVSPVKRQSVKYPRMLIQRKFSHLPGRKETLLASLLPNMGMRGRSSHWQNSLLREIMNVYMSPGREYVRD